MTDEQLTALLRLKRFEQPPDGYFDRLVADIHRRQRAELLQRPLWKIALERVHTLFSEHSIGNLSYAGALAAALVVAAFLMTIATPSKPAIGPSAIAKIPDKVPAITKAPSQPGSLLTLTSEPMPAMTLEPSRIPTGRTIIVNGPRYVIDARPVSYEPESSVQF
jgi:hypothetical protein